MQKIKLVVWDLDNTLWNGTVYYSDKDSISLKPGTKEALKELSKIVKKKIVIIIPYFTVQGKDLYTNFNEFIRKYGFKIYLPVREINIPVKYIHEDKKIKRLIYILEKI